MQDSHWWLLWRRARNFWRWIYLLCLLSYCTTSRFVITCSFIHYSSLTIFQVGLSLISLSLKFVSRRTFEQTNGLSVFVLRDLVSQHVLSNAWFSNRNQYFVHLISWRRSLLRSLQVFFGRSAPISTNLHLKSIFLLVGSSAKLWLFLSLICVADYRTIAR